MKIVTKILLGFVAILLCCITACQIHYHKARRTPAVSGRVVDIETGQPIKGADVMVAIYGFPVDPLAIATPHRLTLTRQYLKTDNQGRFFFPSQVPPLTNVGFSWLSYMIWGPCHQLSIGVYVFPKEYMTVASESEGFGWKEDPYIASGPRRENGEVLVSVARQSVNPLSYEYAIETRKAESEEEWEIKCHSTLFHYQDVAHWERLDEPGETCLFNDLTGYLERFPNGEKAEYYIGTLIEHCDTGCYDDMKNKTQVQRKKMIKLLTITLKAIDHADHSTIYKLKLKFNLEGTIQGMREALVCLNKLEGQGG